jgi:hypothetical protein
MKHDLTEACKACPFKRSSPAGYLGASSAGEFIDTTMRDAEMPCHLTVDYTDPDWNKRLDGAQFCAGAKIFFRNQCKRSRDTKRPELDADREDVFSHRGEFMDYHDNNTNRRIATVLQKDEAWTPRQRENEMPETMSTENTEPTKAPIPQADGPLKRNTTMHLQNPEGHVKGAWDCGRAGSDCMHTSREKARKCRRERAAQ